MASAVGSTELNLGGAPLGAPGSKTELEDQDGLFCFWLDESCEGSKVKLTRAFCFLTYVHSETFCIGGKGDETIAYCGLCSGSYDWDASACSHTGNAWAL